MPTLISVREASSITKFAGDYPNISYYPGVNADLLTEGDDNPMFITMRIAEVGRVSANGLLYDQDLVAAIAEQLQGLGGIQGHIPAGEEASTFKVDAIDWVGHALVEGVLWAKGYIPPGDTREYVRRIRARAGSLGTSIFGYGHRDFVDDEQTVWKSLDFDLALLHE